MNKVIHDDEIDLFEIFQILWDGKRLISAFVALVMLIGLGYVQVAQSKYKVSAPYRVNVYSVLRQQICESNKQICESNNQISGCLDDGTLNILLDVLGGGWNVSNKNLTISKITSTPLPLNQYESLFSDALTRANDSIRGEAISELTLIDSLSNNSILGTEHVSTNLLNAKRVIQSIDNGQNVVALGSVSVVKISPKVSLILALSAVLGGMIGVLFVVIRSALRKRKSSWQKSK